MTDTQCWRTTREIYIERIRLKYQQLGTTPNQLIGKHRSHVIKLSKEDKIKLGIYSFMTGELEAEKEYQEAVGAGAREIILPKEVGGNGYFHYECECEMNKGLHVYPVVDKVDLSLYEHNVWQCPRCERKLAVRNMAAVDDGIEEFE